MTSEWLKCIAEAVWLNVMSGNRLESPSAASYWMTLLSSHHQWCQKAGGCSQSVKALVSWARTSSKPINSRGHCADRGKEKQACFPHFLFSDDRAIPLTAQRPGKGLHKVTGAPELQQLPNQAGSGNNYQECPGLLCKYFGIEQQQHWGKRRLG